MRKSALLMAFAIFGICQIASAQSVSLHNATAELGPELKLTVPEDKDYSEMHLGFVLGTRLLAIDGNYTYMLTKKTVTCFDGNNKIKYAKAISTNFKGAEMEPQFILFSNGNIYAFALYHDKAKKKAILYKSLVEKSTGTLKAPWEVVLDMTDEVGGGQAFFRVLQKKTIGWSYSPDSSKIVISSNQQLEAPKIAHTNVEYNVAVLDKDMKPVWHFKQAYVDKFFTNTAVDNDGVVAAVTMDYTATSGQMSLYTWPAGGGTPHGIPLGFTAKQLEMAFNSDGIISCAAFYSEKNADDQAKGLFYFTVNPKKEAVVSKIDYPFPRELTEQSNINGFKEAKGLIFSLGVEHIIPDNNGGALIIAQQVYKDGDRRYFDAIVAISVGNKKVEWAAAIPKSQESYGPAAGYSLATKGNNVYLLYNDCEENMNRKDYKYKNFRKNDHSEKVLVTIGPDGKYTKESVGKNDFMAMRPFLSQSNGDGKWTIVCGSDNQDYSKVKLLTLKIK